jgi:hypothetical protein
VRWKETAIAYDHPQGYRTSKALHPGLQIPITEDLTVNTGQTGLSPDGSPIRNVDGIVGEQPGLSCFHTQQDVELSEFGRNGDLGLP